jgi:hypothetical protein
VTYLRLGYASYLSSWALMNTGTPETNYGYWYPGKENDGATGWAFTPEKHGPMWIRKDNRRGAWFYDGEIELGYAGALRTAATIVADDPLFGLFAYGGLLSEGDGTLEVIPRDGLRKRFHMIQGERRLHMLLDRDGFAAEKPIVIDASLCDIRFVLENRGLGEHVATLRVAGLPAGDYTVYVDGQSVESISLVGAEWVTVELPVGSEALYNIAIQTPKD